MLFFFFWKFRERICHHEGKESNRLDKGHYIAALASALHHTERIFCREVFFSVY